MAILKNQSLDPVLSFTSSDYVCKLLCIKKCIMKQNGPEYLSYASEMTFKMCDVQLQFLEGFTS